MQWHPEKNISDKLPHRVVLKETIMGCGVYQCYGLVLNIACCTKLTKHHFDTITDIAKYSIETGVGAVLLTCGQAYYHTIPMLIDLGFIEIAEYNNLRHGNDYKQKLFILKLEK